MVGVAETIELAVEHHQAGRLDKAENLYRQALKSGPDNPTALHALGVAAYQRRQHGIAAELVGKAIAISPELPRFHNTLGLVLEALGQLEQAIDAYRRAVQLKPDFAEAYNNMAIALHTQGQYEEAVQSCKQAVLLKPDYAEAYNTMGYALEKLHRYDEAVENYTDAVRFKSDFAEAYNHLGVVLSGWGQHARAIKSYSRAIQIDPDYSEAHWNRALSLLISGRFAEGWKDYQWRRNTYLKMVTYPHRYDVPRWDGSRFVGKRLLVHYEQGFGDTIHFVRYLRMVKARGGTVIFEARKPLVGLLMQFQGIDEVIEASFDQVPATKFDFHISVMDLPGIFKTTLETVPADVPYIYADQIRADYWHRRLCGSDFKVGIVWSGSPTYEKNYIRSCALAHFAPLAEIGGVKMYGLQKGRAAAQLKRLPGKPFAVDLADEFDSFSDTAAVIENLDLVISVDTSVIHLAGAMGKPVWVLLSAAPSWHWMLQRRDSPWYPTARLFRQKKLGEWDDVFNRVREELQMLVAGGIKSRLRIEEVKVSAPVQQKTADFRERIF